MSVVGERNSLANIDRIKPTIRSDFSLEFPPFVLLSLSFSLFYFISLYFILFYFILFYFCLWFVDEKLLVGIHRGSMLFHFCYRKRKQQHVSAMYFLADDKYIDSTIRRTRDVVPRPFPHAHPFQASKTSFMEIPGVLNYPCYFYFL